MPSINVAMESSLRRGVGEMFLSSLGSALGRRGVASEAQGQITDVETAFSSWSNCMQASFCK